LVSPCCFFALVGENHAACPRICHPRGPSIMFWARAEAVCGTLFGVSDAAFVVPYDAGVFDRLATVPRGWWVAAAGGWAQASASAAGSPVALAWALLVIAVVPAAVTAVTSDVVFYVTHRICHASGLLYRRVHKLHHTWVDSHGAAAIAAHPFEHWFVNLHVAHLPGIVAGLPFHWHTAWLVVASLTTVYTHCGFRLPLVAAHDRHHHFPDCEFGADVLCDRLCRTTFAARYPAAAAAVAGAAVAEADLQQRATA